ncbi:MAG TPA: AMIN domain-containing protein, partial [Steroidobacteraceae bacterium]
MIKKAFQFGALGILLSGPALAMPPGSQLREAHLAATASAAQLTLEVSGDPTRQRLFTLDHPRRVVIDLLHTRRASGFRLPAASGLVTDLRTGARPGGTLRLVVQLTSAVSTHSVWISPRGGRRELLINFGHTSAMAELNPDAARSLRERGAVPELAGATAPAEPRIVRALHAPTDSDRDVIIAVDAGHGGQDPGA